MPQWNPPPKDLLKNALTGIWQELETEVIDNPSFEGMVGVPMSELAEHAAEAVATFYKGGQPFTDPVNMVQLYCLGFVVGAKYGEQRATRHS